MISFASWNKRRRRRRRVGQKKNLKCWFHIVILLSIPYSVKALTSSSKAKPTRPATAKKIKTTTTKATAESLTAALQRCYSPQTILTEVGSQVNPTIDPSGIVPSLILVRLSKQLIGIDNRLGNNGGSLVDEMDWKTSDKEKEIKVFCKILRDVVESFTNSNWQLSSRSIEAAIEGTKSASVLSRLLAPSNDVLDEKINMIWRPILQKWHNISKDDSNYDIATQLQGHQLSGLKWSFDCFQISSAFDHEWVLPESIQDSYDQLHLPFRIYPSLFHRENTPDLTVRQLEEQVKFRFEEIRTTSNRIVKERRQTAWEGDDHVAPFEYSGKSMKRETWSPLVRQVRDKLETKTNQYYDCCLLNLYPDGGSGMRYHIDPDQGILWGYETAVVSAGSTRRFAFREIPGDNDDDSKKKPSNCSSPHVFTLMNGDVTEMFGDCQQRYQHTVKTAENKKEKATRSSLVFKKSLLGK